MKADFALCEFNFGNVCFRKVEAPFFKVFKAIFAIFLWCLFQVNQHFWTSLFRTLKRIFEWAFFSARYLGNCFQKGGGGWFLQFLSFFSSGHFLINVAFWSGGDFVLILQELSQNATVAQRRGSPKSSRVIAAHKK